MNSEVSVLGFDHEEKVVSWSMLKSESIQNLTKALVAFQQEVKNPTNTAVNPHFKSRYAPLSEVLNDVRPLLAKHGLAVIQFPGGDGETVSITTMLVHDSGEWLEFPPLVLKTDKLTPQGAGSAITYGRRYTLAAVLGISSEDDDDGNEASRPTRQATTSYSSPTGDLPSNQLLLKRMLDVATKAGFSPDDLKGLVLKHTGKASSRDLTPDDINKVIAAISHPGQEPVN